MFAFAVGHLSHESKTSFSIWYFYDATLGGTATEVVKEILLSRDEAAINGLELNASKCEAVSSSAIFLSAVCDTLLGCKPINPDLCDYFGASIGIRAVRVCLSKRTEALRSLTDRLKSIDRHDALTLLQTALGHPRAVYDLRAGTCYRDQAAIEEYDNALKEAVSTLVCLNFDDKAWKRETLPAVNSGLGLRSANDLLLSAFISSVVECNDMVMRIGMRKPSGRF